jgi:hypothetical protein
VEGFANIVIFKDEDQNQKDYHEEQQFERATSNKNKKK